MEFSQFKLAVQQQFARMSKHQLFRTTVTKEELWGTYLGAFPEGSNPKFRERTEHDCSCCRLFIRDVGGVIAIIDGEPLSIWDVALDDMNYQAVADAMAKLVYSKPIENIFLHDSRVVGTDKSFEDTVNGLLTWNHFTVQLPDAVVAPRHAIPTKLGHARTTYEMLQRALLEITPEAVGTVLELITQNSLYRGEEHRFAVTEFSKLFDIDPADPLLWNKSLKLAQSVSRIRNTSIGTLLVDLSEGTELEDAVKKFEAMVAPQNYKRPTALVTKAMVDNAKAKVEELGLTSALQRRYAKLTDITVNNVLYADRSVRKAMGDVFDELATKASPAPSLSKVEDVPIDKFLSDFLPTATSIELMMNNGHATNLVSLVAPADPTSPSMFKWDNRFSWSYNGDFADSIKERVKQAGGNVTGEFCCRLAWEYADDLDFHMVEPDGSLIYFGFRRQKSASGGVLDVDANGADGVKANPVENIYYATMRTMKEGVYTLMVHNYTRRSNGVGFEVEIDILGSVTNIVYDGVVGQNKKLTVAKFGYTKKDGLKILESMPSTTSFKEVWGVKTNTFQRVTSIMLSPNHWDGQGVGNRHYFFTLEGCKNDGKARGFFNEFLKSELDPHRKVLEMVGSKMLTEESEHQLSGLGFSSTQRNSVLCRITGNVSRIINITF